MNSFYINRRHFLKSSAATLALSLLGQDGLDLIYKQKKWTVGLIGAGWYGTSDILRLIQVAPVEVVAICDVDKKHLQEAATLISQRQASHNTPLLYTDYRELLKKHQLDIVVIGTPDHWHALQAVAAIKAGAHLYLQKPISADVAEGETILAAAKKYNRVIQVGTQRRSTPHLIDAKKKIIDAGLLGKVGHVEMCCYYHMRLNEIPPITTVPDHFDYDFWTGPAPMRPFRGLPHRKWRSFKAYGNGIMGDMCIHMFDTVRWLLDLGWPHAISATGGIYVHTDSIATIPDTQTATFEYDHFNCVWKHRTWGNAPDPDYPWGFFIYGEKGTLKGSVHQYEFIPRGKGEKISQKAIYEKELYPEDVKEKGIELHAVPATRRHFLNLLEAIETGKKPVADIENGHISTTSCILANLAMETGTRIQYDPTKKKILNNKKAKRRLARTYRKPWRHV